MPLFLPALVAPQQAPAQSPRTFAQALDDVPWDPAEKGVLLAVSAERTRPGRGQAIPPPSPRGYNLKELASAFDRMPLAVGRLTVLVPTTMRVLVKPTLSPEEALWENPDAAVRALLASLSKTQWQAVTSERGLGLGDLSEKQQGVFLASLPNPFQAQFQPAEIRERTPGGVLTRFESSATPQQPPSLTSDQRRQVRVRLNRTLRFSFAAEGDESDARYGFGDLVPGRKEAEYVVADTGPRFNRNTATTQDLPNRPKPSDLDTAPLTQPITLTGAKTVGELVQRAAQATNLELYADPRVARLSVLLWGDNARAGDILAALSRVVTGTFRKVGPAYVLTHDRLGLAALYEPQLLWEAELSRLKQAQREVQTKAIQEAKPQDLFQFAPNDPLALPSTLVQNAAKGVPTTALPPALQTRVRAQLTQVHEDIAAGRTQVSSSGRPITQFRSDTVWADFGLRLSYLTPTVGEVKNRNNLSLWELQNALFRQETAPSSSPAPTPPPIVWPEKLERVALVEAQTPEEAKVLAQAAKKGGLTGLWLYVPMSATRAKPLLAAVQAEGLTAGVALAPFEAPSAALPTGATLDLTATLTSPQTSLGQVIRYDDAVLLALKELATLPQLSALYFTDLIPPGYEKPRGSDEFDFRSTRSGDFGYTLDNRLAFLRQTGCDPIDTFAPPSYSSETALPFFVPFGFSFGQPLVPDYSQQWKAFRAAQATAFLPKLHQRLKQVAPKLPLYVPGQSTSFIWSASWDKPDQLPTLKISPGASVANAIVLPLVRQSAARVFNQSFSYPQMTAFALRQDTHEELKAYPGWDGFLLSLVGIPIEQAKALLRGLGEGKELP